MAKQTKNASRWALRPVARSRSRRGSGTSAIVPDAFLEASGIRVSDVYVATPPPAARRGAAAPDIDLDVSLAAGEGCVLAVRHASGALTFHSGAETVQRRGARRRRGEGSVVHFRVPVRRIAATTGRRGVIASAIKVAVVKVTKAAVDAVVGFALAKLVAAWEANAWEAKGLSEGWFQVAPDQGGAGGLRLTPGRPEPGQRSLVFIHGTFSNAEAAFGPLARTDFFNRVRPLYGSRIYAFNHFTLSRTPDENAAALLAGLADGECACDAVTHSRGGLVLRSAVEHRQLHGAPAGRLRLGHAVLVASPNDGTPLATPDRWEQTVGWLANLMEVLPDNPFTTGAQFVSEALVWLAGHVAGDIPGLRAMDGAGDFVDTLQSPPGPALDAYSALVSNFHPDDSLWARALDVGVDAFFASANDLVVPTEGGWRVAHDGTPYVPPSRIGCFGPGGNLSTASGTAVTHADFFGHAETGVFLSKALGHEAHELPLIDPDGPLPDRRFARSTRGGRPRAGLEAERPPTAPGALVVPGSPALTASRPLRASGRDDADTFHLVIMDAFDEDTADAPITSRSGGRRRPLSPTEGKRPTFARVFASYGGARVTVPMRLRKPRAGSPTRFGEIIEMHDRIKSYTNREFGTLPTGQELVDFGRDLFETLFQGDVRRLYDEARSRQQGTKLDFVLTSMVPWIAEKPWEFAYDGARRSFLATEEIHFVRNVLTAIPADIVSPCRGPLRILVAAAQPVGFGRLSVEQEVNVIRRGFEPLAKAGLAEVDVLARATPGAIHERLSTGRYAVVHFIGHGVFNEDTGEGALLFENEGGGAVELGERSVREILCQRGVSLVFLNACQSGSGGVADFNKGVAQALVSHGLPALVANQYSVLDSSATSFAQHFYWSLAQGMTLGEAAREARIAVNYSMQGELIDWAVPVVYARNASLRLCERPEVVSVTLASTVRGTTRRATHQRPKRVAVWDIDDVFPSLDRTLDLMTDAQSVYGFELVDRSTPLDIWDLDTRADDGTPYLRAEHLAHRLESTVVELRVDVLACVTRHWMRSEEWLNIYGWWPDHKEPPVVIFSCAGFDDLQAEGVETDRAIANVMVTALGGFFGELGSHERGAKDCPMDFNRGRSFSRLTGVQRFDAQCRKSLKRSMAKELPALDALLKMFA